jgi:hypothetical protein
MKKPRSNAWLLTLIAALTAVPHVARAVEAEQNQAAVDLAYEGKERFEAGDYATALDRFEKAQALAGSPVFDLYVARCLKALGRWREALAAYEETEHFMVDGSNVSFRQAQENASRERRELFAKMPKLTLEASHTSDVSSIELKIDGETMSWPVVDVPLDPGKHVLTATLGREKYDDVITLSASETRVVELPFGKSAGQQASTPISNEGPTPTERRGLSPLAWTAFGIGAAGLVVGATTGTWAAVNMSSLNEYCSTSPCPGGNPSDPAYQDLKNTTAALATTADIAFVVAGVGAVLGVTFALTLKGRGSEKAAQSGALELRPAGTGLSLSGAF